MRKPHFPMFDANFHPQFGLPVVPAMEPTLPALIMMIESGGSAFVG
jgi:hypothetical protein